MVCVTWTNWPTSLCLSDPVCKRVTSPLVFLCKSCHKLPMLSSSFDFYQQPLLTHSYHWTAYVPLLTDRAWLQVFWQVPNWKWTNTNIDLPRAFLQIAGVFSCWTWHVSVPALARMLRFGSNVELPSALAGHGPHLRQQRAGKKPGAVMKQVGWRLGSWWKDLGSTGRCTALGD